MVKLRCMTPALALAGAMLPSAVSAGTSTATAGIRVQAIDAELAAAIAADTEAAAAVGPSQEARPLPPAGTTRLASMNPDLSLILNVGAAAYSREAHITQGGHAMDDSGAAIQGLELAASASVDPYFRFDLFFELAHLHIEEVAATTLALPWNLQARAGYLIVPFGRANTRHVHSWNFVNPPLSHSRFLSEEHFSGAGAELSVLLPLPWYSMVIADVLDTRPATGMRSSTFARADQTKSGRVDGPEDFVYSGRWENFFALGDDWSLNVGADGAWGQSPYSADDRAELYGGDVYLKWRPISSGEGATAVALTLEYLMRTTQVPKDFARDHGGYARVDVQLDRYWMAGARFGYADALRAPVDDPVGDWARQTPGRQWRASVSATFLPTHFSKVRLQYELSEQAGLAPIAHAGFVAVEVSAGEHGAHQF